MPDAVRSTRRPLRTLSQVALAALGTSLRAETAPELRVLAELGARLGKQPRAELVASYDRMVQTPDAEDERLLELASALDLSRLETLVVALALTVDREVLIGRALSRLQHPLGGSRPTFGLLAGALDWATVPGIDPIDELMTGAALQSGLLQTSSDELPMPERMLAVPSHLAAALRGLPARVAGVVVGLDAGAPRLSPGLRAQAERHARALTAQGSGALAIRSGSVAERRAVAAAVCTGLGRTPLFCARPEVPGLAPWLLLGRHVPVYECELGPSERFELPELAAYDGPRIVTAGPDGGVTGRVGAPLAWHVEVPSPAERRALWAEALGPGEVADRLGDAHRHGCGRIAELSRLARQRAAMDARTEVTGEDVVEAAWSSDASGLEALAEPMRAKVPAESLVLAPRTRKELDLLLLRCRGREGLVEGLGISASTRYRPGVRALFVGPSGSGKTLAVGWLASRLSMPLYRVDVASVVSKYIGETEKNLAQLLARAEDAEVALLFDEADSLFGKRTDVKHANDRFANAQTNYLLQRIETYDGIAILTSNNRSRFDGAFTRRLDFIIDFPVPGPEQRRKLWDVHLGRAHEIEPGQLNALAAGLDLVGGHIRNAVLSAAVSARAESRAISWSDLLRGVDAELRKLGKQLPASLAESGGRVVRRPTRARKLPGEGRTA